MDSRLRRIPNPKIRPIMAWYVKENGIRLTAIKKNGRIQGYKAFHPSAPLSYFFIKTYPWLLLRIKNMKKTINHYRNFPWLTECGECELYDEEISRLKQLYNK